MLLNEWVDEFGIPQKEESEPISEIQKLHSTDIESALGQFGEDDDEEFAEKFHAAIKKAKFKRVSPEEADSFRRVHKLTFDSDPWPGEKGKPYTEIEAAIVMQLGGENYVLDGQHRLNQSIKQGIPVDVAFIDGNDLDVDKESFDRKFDVKNVGKTNIESLDESELPDGIEFSGSQDDELYNIVATVDGEGAGSISIQLEIIDDDCSPFQPYQDDKKLFAKICDHAEVVNFQTLEVKPEYRGQGIASELMDRAMKYTKKTYAGVPIYLNASPMDSGMTLDRLLGLYKKFGFKLLKKFPEFRNALLWKDKA